MTGVTVENGKKYWAAAAWKEDAPMDPRGPMCFSARGGYEPTEANLDRFAWSFVSLEGGYELDSNPGITRCDVL